MTIIERLRNYDYKLPDADAQLAADMLEFFFGQMQMHSPKMNGQHSYRFRMGWPMTHCIGQTAEEGVLNAMKEIKREKEGGE